MYHRQGADVQFLSNLATMVLEQKPEALLLLTTSGTLKAAVWQVLMGSAKSL